MSIHRLKRIAGAALVAAVAALAPLAVASTASHTVAISAQLKVTASTPPCSAGICTIKNHGTGTMTPYGKVRFTTEITADGSLPPCGARSQWVNRIVRKIHTNTGTLVLHEAGLQCPEPGVGPRVDAVWAVDGVDSTGIFHGATGSGNDVAYPVQDTAAPRGTITLAP